MKELMTENEIKSYYDKENKEENKKGNEKESDLNALNRNNTNDMNESDDCDQDGDVYIPQSYRSKANATSTNTKV